MGTSAHPSHSHVSDNPLGDFFARNGRSLGYVAAGILVLAGGAWFYTRSKELKEQHATQAYRTAMQSVMSGNTPLAQSDLKKLTVRYAGTAAGTEGAMALAQLNYREGKFKEGIAVLKAARPSSDMAFDVHTLIAAGQEGLNQSVEAAKEYEAAAEAARFEADGDLARSNAARAYQAAGNRDAAIKIWRELLKKPESPAAAEARVRLGELEAKIIKA